MRSKDHSSVIYHSLYQSLVKVLEWCCNSFEIKKNNFILRMDLTIIHFITPLGRTEKNLYLLILIILHMLRMVLIGCHNHSFSLIGWHILTHTLMLSSYWLNFINLSLTAHVAYTIFVNLSKAWWVIYHSLYQSLVKVLERCCNSFKINFLMDTYFVVCRADL